MKPRSFFGIIATTISAITLLACHAYSSETPTNSELPDDFFTSAEWTNLVSRVNAVADLGTLMNWNANEDHVSDLDKQVCKSLAIRSRSPMLISYKELSVVFHFSKTNELLASSQDMSGPFTVIYQDGKIVRTNTPERIPTNEIILFDPNVKDPTVEIEILLSVAPVEKPQDVKYARRSFRFVHRNGWIN